MSEFEKHTVLVHDQICDGYIKSTRIINRYDPQLMFVHTPESADNIIFQTAARHPSGVNMVYSYSREEPLKEIQVLALSDGTKEDKEEIVIDFDDMLRTNGKEEEFVRISQPIECENDVFKWIIHFEALKK